MTLTQLSAFVLVARLGSVKEAAGVLAVSEPAVSQALAALRKHFDDPLIERGQAGMTLTPGGIRLAAVASQIVALGTEAEDAVRVARGVPDQVRVVAGSTVAEFATTPVIDAFTARTAKAVEVSVGVVSNAQIPVLLANRLADIAIGPCRITAEAGLVSEPVFRCRVIVVASPRTRIRALPARLPWLVDPSVTDPDSETSVLLRRLGVPESQMRVFPNQTAAWAAAAEGSGLAPAMAHLVTPHLQRGELVPVTTRATPMTGSWFVTTLPPERRSSAVNSFRRFLTTPEALHVLQAPGSGVPPSRFRPPVHVTIWN